MSYLIIMLTPLAPITKFLTTSIIAPHGITDLVHAEENNNIPTLLNTYICTNTFVFFLNNIQQENLINILLFIGSVIHFRRDIPIKNIINKSVFTSLMLLYFIFFDENSIYFYLTLIHVPNHYALNWSYLKKNKLLTGLVLSLTTLVSIYFGNKYYDSYSDPFIFDMIKGVILSHIMYEEMYIYKKT